MADSDKLQKVLNICNHLSADEKVEVVRRLAGDCSLSVVFGNYLHTEMIDQINKFSDNELMAAMLKAIAKKISSQDSSQESERNKKGE
ncbi:hypothetical protein VF14_13365 [Nostoc linckia z18]|uniref:Uncharacterized protein n=2 Tax=Nostoc linckia TaxID=92942 RepID=A0A9Q6EL15_NOSLI|nr:hypothetical protein [Nostoc linckia]PHK42288.1 hypothetical protein VF12_03800 [Nostoc linckia z15]PHK45496.1 hypothetical protein VF13_16250 [Nostoc linckia z16]PHJ59073.1 hypothetical protein VF02_26235 [Nostoc linckia z1]PHJ61926.1 hypothetical protein VF05_27930 [Nostoc linckia z3]PHJ67843.1 hypothetical protein VF03_25680 [Nostoc linckia z2]